MVAFLYTLSIWGFVALFIGLFLLGVGVVPVAMLATLLNGMWMPLISLLLLTIMTIASRAGALSLAMSLERSVPAAVYQPQGQNILDVDELIDDEDLVDDEDGDLFDENEHELIGQSELLAESRFPK